MTDSQVTEGVQEPEEDRGRASCGKVPNRADRPAGEPEARQGRSDSSYSNPREAASRTDAEDNRGPVQHRAGAGRLGSEASRVEGRTRWLLETTATTRHGTSRLW